MSSISIDGIRPASAPNGAGHSSSCPSDLPLRTKLPARDALRRERTHAFALELGDVLGTKSEQHPGRSKMRGVWLVERNRPAARGHDRLTRPGKSLQRPVVETLILGCLTSRGSHSDSLLEQIHEGLQGPVLGIGAQRPAKRFVMIADGVVEVDGRRPLVRYALDHKLIEQES
jgi:hypothetical protein